MSVNLWKYHLITRNEFRRLHVTLLLAFNHRCVSMDCTTVQTVDLKHQQLEDCLGFKCLRTFSDALLQLLEHKRNSHIFYGTNPNTSSIWYLLLALAAYTQTSFSLTDLPLLWCCLPVVPLWRLSSIFKPTNGKVSASVKKNLGKCIKCSNFHYNLRGTCNKLLLFKRREKHITNCMKRLWQLTQIFCLWGQTQ